MGIISWFPLRLRWILWGGCCWFSLHLNFQLNLQAAYQSKNKSHKEWGVGIWDAWFQLQQREAFSPRRKLLTIPTSPLDAFMCATKPITHPYSGFSKIVRCNLAIPIEDHKNKWESAKLMEEYYVVGVIVIPYPRFEMIINILSKVNNPYCVKIGAYHGP